MKAGGMDRYVGLYHQVLTQNSLGESVESWPTAYASVWAKVTDAAASRRGDKLVIAEQFAQLQVTSFEIRYFVGLLATDRVVDESGLSYEIVQIGEVGRREGWNLLCKAIAP